MDRTICTHCQVPIVDPTVQVVHGEATYCCANCSAAMEGAGLGSNPEPTHQADGALRCAHCSVPIIHEDTMESRGDDAYCCSNCAAMADSMAEQGAGSGGQAGTGR